MKKKILISVIIIISLILVFTIVYFTKKNNNIKNKTSKKQIEKIIENEHILKIGMDDITTGSYLSDTYYISEDKKFVVITTKGFSETTGKTTNKTKTKNIDSKKTEEYIEKLEKYKSSEEYLKEKIHTYPIYIIEYKQEQIAVSKNKMFFEETEKFLKNIDE